MRSICASRRPLYVYSLVLLVAWAARPARAQEDKLPDAEKILEKTIEAQGGREAFDKLTSRVSTGELLIEAEGKPQKAKITRYEAFPNSLYVELQIAPNAKLRAGCDGNVSWQIDPAGQVKIEAGVARDIALRSATFSDQLSWKLLYPKVECVGKEDIDGQPCYKLVLTPDSGDPVTMFYSRKTGLPMRKEETRASDDGPYKSVSQLLDYREVDGVKLPHKILRDVIYEGRPPVKYTFTWESIQHNVELPADRFKLPKEVESAVKAKP